MGWTGVHLLAFLWLTFGIASIGVIIRVFVNIKGFRRISTTSKNRDRRWCDILIIASLICFLVSNIVGVIYNDLGLFTQQVGEILSHHKDIAVRKLKYGLVQEFVYFSGLYLCKFDLILLYHNLAPPRSMNRWIFRMLVGCWVFCIAGFLQQIFTMAFLCWPFSSNWDPNAHCLAKYPWFYPLIFGFHLITDVVVYVIPLIIISRLQKFPLSKKLQAGAMFGIGFINVAGGFLTMLGMVGNDHPQSYWSFYGLSLFLGGMQQATAIWIVCTPHVRIFISMMKQKSATSRVGPLGFSQGSSKGASSSKGSVLSKGTALSGSRLVENSQLSQHSFDNGSTC